MTGFAGIANLVIYELVAGVIFFISFFVLFTNVRLFKVLLIAFTFMILGSLCYYRISNEIEKYDSYKNGEVINLQGTIDGFKTIGEKEYIEFKSNGNVFYLLYKEKGKYINSSNDEKGYFDIDRIGNEVKISGYISKFDTSHNPGNYNEKKYYNSLKVISKIEIISIDTLESRRNIFKIYMVRLRGIMSDILKNIAGEEGKILSAIILGEKTMIESETKDMYQNAGIIHILSVSGLHIGMVGNIIFSLLRKRYRYYTASVVSTSFMVLFAILTGGSVSTIRALIMFIVMLVAKVVGNKYDLISSLMFAMLLMLLSNPMYILNSSFELSVLAIAGIAFVYPVLEKHFLYINEKYIGIIRNRKLKNIVSKIVSSILVSISVSISTFPVLASTYFKFATYSIFLNLIIIPFMSILLGMGLVVLIVAIVCKPLAVFLVGTDVMIVKFMNILCEIWINLPGNTIYVKQPELSEILVYYAALAIGLFLLNRYGKRMFFLAMFVVMCVCMLNKADSKMIFMDVGQGDCCVINIDGDIVLVDGGSSSIKNVAKYRISKTIESLGIRKIKAIFISHTDSDHISGIEDMINESIFDIEVVFMPDYKDKEGKNEEFLGYLKEHGIEYKLVSALDVVEIKEARFNILSPVPKLERNYSDINDGCMSMIMKYNNVRVAFMGDATEVTEKTIFDNLQLVEPKVSKEIYELMKNVDILKVGHHGSKTSTSIQLLEMFTPKEGVISVGFANKYKHPHDITIEKLEKYGVVIYRTDKSGGYVWEL